MKNQKGSAIIWALVTIMLCGLILMQIGDQILFYTKQTKNEIDNEQTYLTCVDCVNIFADEIIKDTELGNKLLSSLLSGNSLSFENVAAQSNCNSNLKIEMPFRNKIEISSHSTKNDSAYKLCLTLILDETESPSAWKIKNYRKESE